MAKKIKSSKKIEEEPNFTGTTLVPIDQNELTKEIISNSFVDKLVNIVYTDAKIVHIEDRRYGSKDIHLSDFKASFKITKKQLEEISSAMGPMDEDKIAYDVLKNEMILSVNKIVADYIEKIAYQNYKNEFSFTDNLKERLFKLFKKEYVKIRHFNKNNDILYEFSHLEYKNTNLLINKFEQYENSYFILCDTQTFSYLNTMSSFMKIDEKSLLNSIKRGKFAYFDVVSNTSIPQNYNYSKFLFGSKNECVKLYVCPQGTRLEKIMNDKEITYSLNMSFSLYKISDDADSLYRLINYKNDNL